MGPSSVGWKMCTQQLSFALSFHLLQGLTDVSTSFRRAQRLTSVLLKVFLAQRRSLGLSKKEDALENRLGAARGRVSELDPFDEVSDMLELGPTAWELQTLTPLSQIAVNTLLLRGARLSTHSVSLPSILTRPHAHGLARRPSFAPRSTKGNFWGSHRSHSCSTSEMADRKSVV